MAKPANTSGNAIRIRSQKGLNWTIQPREASSERRKSGAAALEQPAEQPGKHQHGRHEGKASQALPVGKRCIIEAVQCSDEKYQDEAGHEPP